MSVARFGRYRLLECLGQGGMATVYRAVVDGPKGFSRELVVKRILPECARAERFVDMLAAEARLSALLRHPAIVQVHEFGEIDGEYYLAMELVDGNDLVDVLRACILKRRTPPPGVVCHLIRELASALAYAHALCDGSGRALAIVHRDVSPSNVMVTRAGAVKLVDFGIAKAADHVRDVETKSGVLKGKVSYLSPEQADGLPIDRRSDIFALGIVFHECLTLKRLFKAETELETLRRIRNAEVVPPAQLVDGLDPEIDALVCKMLARDPAARFASCDELVEVLAPIARRLGGDAVALGRFIAELGDVARRSIAAPRDLASPAHTRSLSRAPEVNTSTATRASGELLRTERREAGRPRWPWLAATAVAGVIAVAIVVVRAHSSTVQTAARAAPSVAAAPVAAPSASAPATPDGRLAAAAPDGRLAAAAPDGRIAATAPDGRIAAVNGAASATTSIVTLTVHGTRGAEVIVDGATRGSLPVELRLPRAAGLRRVVVRARGYKSWSAAVAADEDVALTATLARARSGAAPAGILKDPFHH